MYWHKEASQLIGKKPKCYGIKKFKKKKKKDGALKYPPLVLKKLQVTFTKRLSFKPTYKGHSSYMSVLKYFP